MPELEVERIVRETWRKGKQGRRVKYYKVRYVGLGPEEDEWKTRQGLKNAPDVLKDWETQGKDDSHLQHDSTVDKLTHHNVNSGEKSKTRVLRENPATATLTRPTTIPSQEGARRSSWAAERATRA